MNIKVILCNCNGLKFMPEGLDMNTLPYELESDTDIAYAVVHPQLCGSGGVNMLHDLLKAAEPDDYFIVAGCGPENQPHFLGHVVDEMQFPSEQFVGVNIRGMDNHHARTAILEAVGDLLARKREATFVVDAFGG
jgi:heterodisulfide reductase subunit A-like polyferredoxin